MAPAWIRGTIVCTGLTGFLRTARAETAPSHSEDRLPVLLAVAPCTMATPAGLQRITSAELGIAVAARASDAPALARDPATGLARPRQSDDPNVTLVDITCVGKWLRLEVLDPVSGKTLVRHLDLSGSDASTRTRLLALSVAELVAASWIELAVRPAPRPHIVEAKASPSAKDAALTAARKALAPPSSYTLAPLGTLRRTGDLDLLTAGGGLGATFAHRGFLTFGGDLLVESGGKDVPLGTIRTLLFSTSASLRIRRALGVWAVEGGLGARLGLARMQGIAAPITPAPIADSATLPWWGPMINLRVEVSIVRRLSMVLGFEAGLVLRAVDGRAGGRAESTIDGEWMGLTLGPALAFGDER